jgi:hypothetical protein
LLADQFAHARCSDFFENFETDAGVYCVLTIRQKKIKNQSLEQLHSRKFCWKLSRQLRLGLAPRSGQGGRQLPLLLVALTTKVQT